MFSLGYLGESFLYINQTAFPGVLYRPFRLNEAATDVDAL